MADQQRFFPWSERNYSYMDYYQKAYENEKCITRKKVALYELRLREAHRDFYTCSIRQMDNLIQIDPTPNLELKEARCEIYKISVSFKPKSELNNLYLVILKLNSHQYFKSLAKI